MILLDTHVLIWWVSGLEKLPAPVLREIESHKKKNNVAVAAISFWETAMLYQKGRLSLNTDLETWIRRVSNLPFLQILPIDHMTLVQSVLLPGPFHADPADRILVATARQLGASLITRDRKILDYPHVKSFWNERD